MHQTSVDKMKMFKDGYLDVGEKLSVLDIGSLDINGTYKFIFNEVNWEYKGADIEIGPNVDIVLESMYKWNNIDDESFDVIISGQTFEHIEFFWLTMEEINRILKPGGHCCLIAPSKGEYHGYPLDCYRFSADGFRALAKYVNFDVLHCLTDTVSHWGDTCLITKKPY